ncbi:MAG: endopeptidase La [Oscillospiraceae bacterium]|jgi:ATP-dependent Lon protease|nr:endopeptidase La [Oscillospiraceae bacterium]
MKKPVENLIEAPVEDTSAEIDSFGEIQTIEKNAKETKTLPMLALRGLVAFPGTIIHFDVQRDKSKKALELAMSQNQEVFLTAQKDIRVDDPEPEDLYSVGVAAKVRQVMRVSPNIMRVLVEGDYRAKALSIEKKEDTMTAEICEIETRYPETPVQTDTVEALVRIVKEQFEEYAFLTMQIPPEVALNIVSLENPGSLVDFISANLTLPLNSKQELLAEANVTKRLRKLTGILEHEINIRSIENELGEKLHNSLDKNQREYFLREQLKVISQELGEDHQNAAGQYREKLKKLKASDEVRQKLGEEIDRLAKMHSSSPETAVISEYLDICFSLPFGKYTKDKINIKAAEKLLNRDHYGLEKVKERILELLSVRQLAPDIKGQIICLVGPPGVGKTSVAKSIAASMGRKYARISLGGVRDEADIRGHRKTYIGAMPGRIIDAIKRAGSANPLILLDEVDKTGNDFRGDPASALLEVLDAEQNSKFVDHYIDLPFDLSKVLFVTTANILDTIPAALLDRMEVIELNSYTREEKFQIAKKHLLPRQIKEHGLDAKRLKVDDGALYSIIDFYTREAGVRLLEKAIAKLCRKAARLIVGGVQEKVNINAHNINSFLGTKKFRPEKIRRHDEIGVVNGLAWTPVGGEIMQIEVGLMKGAGKIELTGSLGKIIRESAYIAISYVRGQAEAFGIDPDFYRNLDIHIHAPEGAVPKDGPSAGVTMVTALVSALKNCPVKNSVAMTGEVTLRGRVLPIGGLKEKSMAAYRAGVSTVLIPEDNWGDLDDVDKTVKEGIKFIPMSNVENVLVNSLVDFVPAKGKILIDEIERLPLSQEEKPLII